MPIVGISTARLKKLLGKDLTSERIAEAIDQLGCDLEEVADVLLYECPACRAVADRLPREDPPKECAVCGTKTESPFAEVGTDEVVRLDLLPARPDLFDSGGLSRALVGYLGIETGLPEYPVEEGDVVVRVDPSVMAVRPLIACAEVVMPPLDQQTLVEVFQLQENLHWAVGRDRKKASIGVYDLATHGTEIIWTAEPPDYRFVPLGMPGTEMTLTEILERHPKGVRYAELLAPYDRYPILVDTDGQVLSMPPVINSEETKLALGAERLFVDVTGHDRRAVDDCLAILVTSLAELGGTIRGVRIENGADPVVTPELSPRPARLSPRRAATLIGVDLDEERVVSYLDRMRLGVADRADGEVEVLVPRYRVDVKHEVDLIEDVAIAHGYHELPAVLVPTQTVGRADPRLDFARKVRRVLTGLGATEVVNFLLTNPEEHLARMGLPEDVGQAVILNPISVNQTIVRTNLLSGLMATFAANRTREMPQLVFEIGTVVRATAESSAQSAHLGVGETGPRADYARIRGAVDSLLHEMDLEPSIAPLADHELLPVFLPGRAALVSAGGREMGVIGEVHPEVITTFGLDHPVVLAELDLAALAGEEEE
ncbi:MAG: phenylalanine--tRNA ligase subunit beta [Planctomycetota bacterium]|jgi:phenylalanyl-tRNA synthetase beta chain